MLAVFWYFLKRSIDDTAIEPLCIEEYIGEIGDFVEIDGVGFYIDDYTVEYD